MAISISKIENLTNKKVVISEADTSLFSSAGNFSPTIKAKVTDITKYSGFDQNDDIQVTWADGSKTIARGVGGELTVDNGKKEVTISGLKDVSKYTVDLSGQMYIGSKDNPAVKLSVRIGNRNKRKNWIADFSDKRDGAPGSKIGVQPLIDWIAGSTGGSKDDIELPETSSEDSLNNLTLNFKEFHFNLTEKTFNMNVQSEGSIQLGDFKINKVGFIFTNEPESQSANLNNANTNKLPAAS